MEAVDTDSSVVKFGCEKKEEIPAQWLLFCDQSD